MNSFPLEEIHSSFLLKDILKKFIIEITAWFAVLFAVGCDVWQFLLLAISPQTSQLSVNSCAIDQSVTLFLGWWRVCLLQKSQQSVFSRLVLSLIVIITSWFAISLDEIRTIRILREKADCKQSKVIAQPGSIQWSYIVFFFHLCMFNLSFLPMQWIPQTLIFISVSMLTPSQTLLFGNKCRWHMQICYKWNTCFLRCGWSCRTFSFKAFFQVRKFLSHIPVTCKFSVQRLSCPIAQG